MGLLAPGPATPPGTEATACVRARPGSLPAPRANVCLISVLFFPPSRGVGRAARTPASGLLQPTGSEALALAWRSPSFPPPRWWREQLFSWTIFKAVWTGGLASAPSDVPSATGPVRGAAGTDNTRTQRVGDKAAEVEFRTCDQ